MSQSTALRGGGREQGSEVIGSLAVVAAAAAWGTSGVFVKLVAAEMEISALALAFWRDFVTFAVLLTGLALFSPSWLRVNRADLPWLLGLGASLGIFHVFWNLGVFLNGAAVATVQQAAMPAIVTVVAWVLWRESLTWSKILAIILTFAGTVLVSGLDALGQTRLSLGGFLVGLGVPITYASWNLFGKKVRETYNPLTTLTYGFGFGALILLPFQAFTPQPWPITPLGVTWFGALILLSTVFAFGSYTYGLGRLPASVATILVMSEIAFVAVYAYFLLGERLTPSQLMGAALVIGGILLLSWSRWKRQPQRVGTRGEV